MFDHVINPTINHIKGLLNEAKLKKKCKYLCLAGGLSSSPYYQNRMKQEFGPKSKYKLQLIIPQRPILSVVEGAAYFGITPNYISQSIKIYVWEIGRSRRSAAERVPEDHIQKYRVWNDYRQIG